MSALLEVRGLRKAYGERLVLDDVSLSVAAGDVVCLIGSSGSVISTTQWFGLRRSSKSTFVEVSSESRIMKLTSAAG